MRIVIVNHRYAPFMGGSERMVQEIAERLAKEGHASRVVTTDAFDLEYFWNRSRRRVDAPELETLNGVDVRRARLRHLPAAPVVFQGTRRLMGELSRARLPPGPFDAVALRQPWIEGLGEAISADGPPDLVVGTNIGLEGLALRAQRLAARCGARYALLPFMHLGREDDAVARRYVTMPHQRRLLRRSDAVIAMTDTEAAFIAGQGVPRDRIVVAGAGMNPDEICGGDGAGFRARHRISGHLVVGLGALAPDKGSRELVSAIALLRGRGVDVELCLAGPSMTAFERWYTRLDPAERSGARMLGVIGASEKRDMLAAADVVALPSRTESFGIVFVEAWANRKPVVGANAGAVPDLVHDGVNGLLTPFGDPRALAGAIERLIDDPALARNLGENGHRLAMERYTWDAVHSRVRHAFELAIGRPLSGPNGDQ